MIMAVAVLSFGYCSARVLIAYIPQLWVPDDQGRPAPAALAVALWLAFIAIARLVELIA